jgi:hypothetical protein
MHVVSKSCLARLTEYSAKKLNKGQDLMFEASLTNSGQTVRAYVMCDTIGAWVSSSCLRLLLIKLAGTMRSAVLQPDIPPHVFPSHKATESNKAQLGKPASNRTSSKIKSGSKRKASETDEFGDAELNDADLALAENGGFENIDDFDDGTGPKVRMPKKKQRMSSTHDEETTAHEPRQLVNGKWACNHNCKDKSSCKHLCCREGLDKKPKPSKARTSKKEAENLADPKQTHLSLSVSKGAKTPSATQPVKDQQSCPTHDRNPPRGPEIYSLNTLHNNAKSNAQPVPLLRGTSSGARSPNAPIILPRPGQSRTKITEAARRAAQNVYSDDFGDIDDMSSLFEEPTADRPSIHSNLTLETESDHFGTDIGDMLDGLSPANKDDVYPCAATTARDNHKNGSSVYGVEEDMLLPLEQALDNTRRSDPSNTQLSAGRSAGPFVEVSHDSALFDLGCRREDRGSTSTIANDSVGYADATPVVHESSHGNAPTGGVSDERPTSSDSATKVFMEELGTDLFNYTG